MKQLLLSIICLIPFLTQGQNYRYVQNITSTTSKISDVIYDTAPFIGGLSYDESNTYIDDLVMDIYLPVADTNTFRPVIIFAHSGGFITGSRTVDDMVAFCDSFARKGYVTATIDYRQGMYLLSNADIHSARAAYRGLQDGRSAIRYLRANAATYGIDPDNIYFVGSSAGAFIALHSVYMDKVSEKPTQTDNLTYNNIFPPFTHTAPDMGGIDIGSNLSESGTPNAIISLWGAVADTNFIESNNNEVIFLVHGTADGTVPFDEGFPFGIGLFPPVFGSNLIQQRFNHLGLNHAKTYFVPNEDHEFHGTSNGTWANGIGGNAYWDILVNQSTDFLWQYHKPTADFSYASNGYFYDFTDLTPTAVSWLWDFGDGNTSTAQHPSHTYLSEGDYQVQLYVENDLQSWDTISYSISVELQVATVELNTTYQVKLYPNPTTDKVYLSFNKPIEPVTFQVMDIKGQLLIEKTNQFGTQFEIDLTSFSSGLYFIKTTTKEDDYWLKVVKK